VCQRWSILKFSRTVSYISFITANTYSFSRFKNLALDTINYVSVSTTDCLSALHSLFVRSNIENAPLIRSTFILTNSFTVKESTEDSLNHTITRVLMAHGQWIWRHFKQTVTFIALFYDAGSRCSIPIQLFEYDAIISSTYITTSFKCTRAANIVCRKN
jgi:hypothetical protein